MQKLTALVILFLSFVVFAKNEDVAAHIAQLDKEWGEAYVKRDIKKLESLMAEEMISTDPEGILYLKGKEQDLAGIKSGELVYDTLKIERTDVKVYGDTAVAVGKFFTSGKLKGQPFSGNFAYTETWVKRNGKWQAVAEHVAEIKPQPKL